MSEKLQESLYETIGNGRSRLPDTRLILPTHRLERLLAEQEADGRPIRLLDESDYVAVLEERNDVPILVARQQNA